MLSVYDAECRYAECHYAECHGSHGTKALTYLFEASERQKKVFKIGDRREGFPFARIGQDQI
jgi:hypothetical protein